ENDKTPIRKLAQSERIDVQRPARGASREDAMNKRLLLTATAALALGAALTTTGWTQSAPAPASLPDQEIGHKITIKAEDLPAPYKETIAASRSMTLPYEGQVPHVPEGF